MPSKLTDARVTLHDALAHIFDDPVPTIDGNLLAFSTDRVHAWPPQTVAAPCLWMERPRGSIRTSAGGARLDVVTFPVAVIYDGANRAQVAGLDELVARVWDWARTVGDPVGFDPGPLDVGGPSLRATYVDVVMRIGASTLCGPAVLSTMEEAV